MQSGRQEWIVTPEDANATVAAFLRERLGLAWREAKRLVETGKVTLDGVAVTEPGRRLSAVREVALQPDAARPRPAEPAPGLSIMYADRHVVVIDKPVGISTVPFEAGETGTAFDLTRKALRRGDRALPPPVLHVVHRIDRATSGLVAFALSKLAERGLALQLRHHSMERSYLCVAHGQVRAGRIESDLVRDRGDGLRGSTRRPGQGRTAITHVEVVEHLATATLCRIRLETGRTHQIRIHLAESGHPVVGEAVYIRDYTARGGAPIPSPRLLLHAATLGFEHPVTGDTVRLTSPLPEDFEAVLERLRGAGSPPT